MATKIADLRQKASQPITQVGMGTLAHYLQANKHVLTSLLPKHITPERMMRLALNAVRTTPQLQECKVESIMAGVVLCAQLGVEPNTPLGHAYLIPFRNKKKNVTEAQFILGYKGMLMLARQSGEISSIDAQVVYDQDDFEYEKGLDEKLRFRKAEGRRGDFRGVYIVVRYKDGSSWFDWLSAHDVYARRDRSQGYQTAIRYGRKDTPWITDFEAMARKTAVRYAMPWLTISTERLGDVMALEAAADRGDSQNLEAILGDDGAFAIPSPDITSAAPAEAEQMSQPKPEPAPASQQPPAPEPDQPPAAAFWNQNKPDDAPEWSDLQAEDFPVKIDPNTWVDANGEAFDGDRHAWNAKDKRPSVKQDGTFRAARGAAASDPGPDDPDPPTFDLE